MSSLDAMTGMRLAQNGNFAEALPHLENANRAAPLDLPVLHACADAMHRVARFADAVERYRIAASLLPGNPEVLTGWARSLLLSGEHDHAKRLLEQALKADPHYPDAGGFLAALLREENDSDAACNILRPLVDRYPTHPDLLWQYALALVAAEHLREGQAAYERYRILRPHDPLACVALGRLAVILGQSENGVAHFRSALEIDSQNAPAIWGLAQANQGRIDAQTLSLVQRLAQSEQNPGTTAVLEDILARHHDSVGEFHAAAGHITRMNALRARVIPARKRYATRQREQETDAAIRNYTPELFDRLRGAGRTDRRPVFIIGLPRSGTTLLEQMLASHPSIVSVGEQSFASAGLRRALIESGGTIDTLTAIAVASAASGHLGMLGERVQRLSADHYGERIVDKLPDNYMFAGWISIAFPNAAIIHCLRDPRDVALSCWQTQFADITWNFELDHIAHRIEQHRGLMRHWHATIEDHLTEIRYESLVANPETELRRALAAIGLEWHPKMLDFAERNGVVPSASQQQVRQPLHARSVGRWRHYEEALRPVLPRLNAIATQDALDADSENKI